MVFVIKILFIISRLLILSWSYKVFDFIHHCFGYEMDSEWIVMNGYVIHALWMGMKRVCNEMSDLFPSNEL